MCIYFGQNEMQCSILANRKLRYIGYWLVQMNLQPIFASFLFFSGNEQKWTRKVVQMVLLVYQGKTVRQAPFSCIFAGDKVTYAQVATKMTFKMGYFQLSESHIYIEH